MFSFLKKKKAIASDEKKVTSSVTFESHGMDTHSEYNPWDASKGNAANEYANANFIHAHEQPRLKAQTPDDYARYMSYDLGIHDPIRKFEEMLKEGFLETANKADVLATLKVAELKDILQKHEVQTKERKKAELIDRILATLDVNALGLPEMYTISSKGSEYIERHNDMLKLFRNPYNVSFEEYIAAKESASTGCSYNDIIWSVFNKRELEIPVHHNGGRRNNALHRAMFLREENRLVDALNNYITVLYFDVNDYIISEEKHAEFVAKYGSYENEKPYAFIVAPAIKENIQELKEFFVDEMIERSYSHYIDPETKIAQIEFKHLVVDLLDNKEIEIDNYYKFKR